MVTSLLAFVIAATVAAILTPIVRDLASSRGFVDRSDGVRKLHDRAIPRVGGVAIIVGFYVPLLAIRLVHSTFGSVVLSDRARLSEIAVAGLLVGGLGVYDDLRGADARTKFVIQFVVAVGLYALGHRIERIGLPFVTVELGWLSAPITILWIVGVTNAMNLIDGLDGLAGGVALIALTAVFGIAFLRVEPFMMFFAAALAGAVAGFLIYNVNPASVFMGDSGSLFLGFMLATSSVKASQKASTAMVLFPLVLLALPIADTLLALVRRALRRQQLFTGDREHVHHRLMGLGFSHGRAVIILCSTSGVFGLSAIALYVSHNPYVNAILVATLGAASLAGASRLWWQRRDRNAPRVIDDSGIVSISKPAPVAPEPAMVGLLEEERERRRVRRTGP